MALIWRLPLPLLLKVSVFTIMVSGDAGDTLLETLESQHPSIDLRMLSGRTSKSWEHLTTLFHVRAWPDEPDVRAGRLHAELSRSDVSGFAERESVVQKAFVHAGGLLAA
eukprot:scaffold1071_cov252-Pinguiococcus_pyrenoidosus.AAC.11